MKINQVEQLVGITKKNIRFYEEQGLLAPSRNKDNGYREYSEQDIKVLEQIKLLRKLGIPLEEIRLMQSGKSTVSDSMKRHLITLERERLNLSHSVDLCTKLKSEDILLENLDVHALLSQMESMEKSGTSFKDIEVLDIKSAKYAGAVIASLACIALMAFFFIFIIWAAKTDPQGAPPLPFLIVILAVPVVITGGVLLSLKQRIGEIKHGEIDDAKKY